MKDVHIRYCGTRPSNVTILLRPEDLSLLLLRKRVTRELIILDIASPQDHRVYEKESEKVEKYQDLKREIRKFMGY